MRNLFISFNYKKLIRTYLIIKIRRDLQNFTFDRYDSLITNYKKSTLLANYCVFYTETRTNNKEIPNTDVQSA